MATHTKAAAPITWNFRTARTSGWSIRFDGLATFTATGLARSRDFKTYAGAKRWLFKQEPGLVQVINKRKPGRPAADPSAPAIAMIGVKVSERAMVELDDRAQQSGLDRSAYVRMLIERDLAVPF